MKTHSNNKLAWHSKLELREMLSRALLPPPTQGRGGNLYPDDLVTNQDGKTFRFYSDLIRDKVVLINFTSLNSQKHFPAMDHMAKIANRLVGKLGTEIFIYTLTTDLLNDTHAKLAAYAKERNIPNGWHLLRPFSDGDHSISDRFAKHLSKHHHSEGINTRMAHYGNGSVGLWAAFAIDTDPDMAVSRLDWVHSGHARTSSLELAGPSLLSERDKDKNSNRAV